jgi:flagellar protein FliO/FliZ
LKRIALVLCAVLALGAGAAAGAQGNAAPSQAAAGNAVGTARAVDETTLTLGDSGATAKAASNAAGSSTLAYFLRMVLVLALVLAAIYAIYRLMKRASRPKTADDPAIKVLASTSLGQGKALHVVSLGSKAYLVGATDSSVSLVAEVEDKELLDALALQAAMSPAAPKAGSARDFGELLAGIMGGRGRRAGSKQARRDGDFLAGQRERLRKF